MRSSNNPFPFVFLFTTIVLSTIGTTTDLVTTICKKTPNPTLCETSLMSDPRSSQAKDSEALILIMIDITKNRFLESVQYVEDLSRKIRDPDTIRALKTCSQAYKFVLDNNVDVAVRAVQQGNPKYGEEAMVDSGNEAEDCPLAFSHGKVPSPIMDRTQMLHGVSNVAASLIKILE